MSNSTKGEFNDEFREALSIMEAAGKAVEEAMDKHKLDALMFCEAKSVWTLASAGGFPVVSLARSLRADRANFAVYRSVRYQE